MKALLAQLAPLLVAFAALGSSACNRPPACVANGLPAAPCPDDTIVAWAAVEGVVTGANGAPLSGIEVMVVCPPEPAGSQLPLSVRLGDSRESDDAGRYRASLALDTLGGRHVDWTAAGTVTMECAVWPRRANARIPGEPDRVLVTFHRRRNNVVATPLDMRVLEP